MSVRALVHYIYWSFKVPTCWRYLPTGYRETRRGTNSDFCRRCAQPAGYHRVTWRYVAINTFGVLAYFVSMLVAAAVLAGIWSYISS